MNNIQKRFLLFLFGCIAVRTLFAYVAKTIDVKYLPYLGALAILPAVGFLYIFFTKSRETGREVFGEKIWWNNLRPLHALLYLTFAFLAFQKKQYSWIPLAVDVCVGLVSFLTFHYLQGNFQNLF